MRNVTMNKISKFGAITITAAALSLASLATVASSGDDDNDCNYSERGGASHSGMMGGGHNGGHMDKHMGSGMMGSGMMGMMGGNKGRMLDLTADEVGTLIKARLIMHGNDRLKVGKVAVKDDQTYLVDIVTVDDSLVRQIEVGKNMGFGRGMMQGSKQ